MEIKNLKKAAERIKKAVKNKEKIILYGDSDLDGATSIIILKETIKNLGGEITAIHFSDREKDGYGISKNVLYSLKEKSPALLISLDCGISNFEEILLAKEMGFDVMVIDHHEVLDKLPEADIIVDPKQKGDKSSFQYLANVGLAYKLSELLFSKKTPEQLRRNFLELVALGTIADMMPREGENQTMIEEGLNSLEDSWRPGLKVFLKEKIFDGYKNIFQKVSKIISILNIRDIENRLPASYRLLTTPSLEEAKKLLSRLIEKSFERDRKKREMKREIEESVSRKVEPIIFEGDSSWDLILLGSIASILSREHRKPVFLFKKGKKESCGSTRSSIDTDLVEAMKGCSDLLMTFGGHPKAAGFRLKNENLEKFKNCLIRYFKEL